MTRRPPECFHLDRVSAAVRGRLQPVVTGTQVYGGEISRNLQNTEVGDVRARMVLVKSEGWRGEIRDREVVRSHEDVLREEQESSRAEEDDYQEGEDERDDEAQHDEYEK